MKLGKKIIAAVLAAATALTALTVSSFANDVIGTNPTPLKDGVQVTAQIPYDKSGNYDDGHNYKDFIFTASASGTLKITFDISCNTTQVYCYRADTMEGVSRVGFDATSGSITDGLALWNGTTSVFSGAKYFNVEKGDYYIRVTRHFPYSTDRWKLGDGTQGNGRLHITAEMVKPDAPQDIQVVSKTDTTVKLQWREPDNASSYDLRYKASGASQWTTVTDIMDNNYTIKKLKGATKYTYQMRSKTAGGLAGEWSKSASFKTNDPKNVKFDVPKVNTSVAVHITWGAVKNATGYKFQYSTDKKNWKTITVEDPAVDMPVTPGKTYYYKVAAKNSAKTGSFSKVYSIKIG
ncbi:MAG: fibronectin type III domain-containing protein [Oscillospiraceae bacterium]|nr:fibronectin type III domain-containing protein [Oscillospiraceae bacterium]